MPRAREVARWTEVRIEPNERLLEIEAALRTMGAAFARGGALDRWDLRIRGGMLGSARALMAVEEHGSNTQLVRWRCSPVPSPAGVAAGIFLTLLSAGAALDGAVYAAVILGIGALFTAVRTVRDSGYAQGAALQAFNEATEGQTVSARDIRRQRARASAPRDSWTIYGDLTLYRRLIAQARPYWSHIIVLILLGLLSTPIALLTPLPLKIAVDSVSGSEPLPGFLSPLVPDSVENSQGAVFILAGSILVVTVFVGQLQALATSLLTVHTGENLVLRFRARLFRHLQRLSLSYHDTRGGGDSIYRLQHDATAIQNIMIGGLIPFFAAMVTLVVMLYVTLRIDWQLALVALGVAPGLLLLTGAYRRRLRTEWRDVKRLESANLGGAQEVFGALRVVKAFAQEDREEERFLDRGRQQVNARVRLALVEGGFSLLVGLTTAIGTALVLYIGILHVDAGTLTLGEMLLVMGYLTQLYEPFKTISRKAASLQSHLASAERAFSLLDEIPDVPEKPDARPLSRAQGSVSFRDVSFSHTPNHPVLRRVSFDIAAGQRVGISGVTGAGKTSLVNLLCRFYDPSTGSILLDGVDLRDYRVADVRSQFAIVLQDPVLFSASIAENIAYGRVGAGEKEIVAAAEAAGAHEFIIRLPDGYDTQVGERGMRLSGGERQRISLARAFLKDARILVLDEPTSSVDLTTEAAIVQAMRHLMEGRTTFLIAHRPSLIEECDIVLKLDHGRLVECGTRIPPELTAVLRRDLSDGSSAGLVSDA